MTVTNNSADLKQRLSAAAARLGLDAFGVTTPQAIAASGSRFNAFIAEGRHGDMEWMATNADRRADPRVLWPEARSVVMVGLSYAPESDPMLALANRSRAAISVYAKRRDYHDVLKAKVRALAQELASLSGADVKIFVDTAPLLEKPLAAAAGAGWQGKHTNLVSRTHGSWLFLGAILTTAEIAPDAPETDHCGSCRRCLDVCPTDAFPAPYQLDARRCLAYLTIEHKGHIPRAFRAPLGNRVFGCDDCLAVCPWNKFAATAHEAKLATRSDIDNPPLRDLLSLDDATFRTRFAGTPIKRTGRNRIVRNALIAAGNSDDPSLLRAVTNLIDDDAAIVRAMAVWALAQLASPEETARWREHAAARETDADVRLEWQATTEEQPA